MNEELVPYEADFEREYETLTPKHEAIRSELEKQISKYIKGADVKPGTIQGPYGSGKTQLLYHLFKFTWENGGVAIYTHLEKIIPRQEVGPAMYADYLKELIREEVGLLTKGKSTLMSGRLKDFATSRIKQTNSDDSAAVLFIDEIEQQYKLLDERIETDDHSPMRDVIARVNNGEAGFYLVLAFAPVSFYEFSKGEAQTGRFFPCLLPIIEPKTFRLMFGQVGNLIWWMGRGRYRGVARTQDILKTNVANINEISKKELLDVCLNTGSIGGVPVLEFESIDKISDFTSFRDFLVQLEPKENRSEIYSGNIKIVKKCRLYKGKKEDLNEILEKSLRSSEVSRLTDINYYLSVILDGLSSSDGKVPLFIDSDDWGELLNIVEDIMLEFEGEDRLPSADLRRLQDNISEFSYNIRRNADPTNELREAYCIAPTLLHTLCPFPISSPNLTNKKIEELRESLGDQTYLAKEEYDGLSVFFFLNESKIRDYLMLEGKNFLKETKLLVAVNLGKEEKSAMPKLAQWLRKEGRFRIITLSRILSDFLVSFLYWVRHDKGYTLPIVRLFNTLTDAQVIAEKDRARKIGYYNTRVREYLDSELPKLPRLKYVLHDKGGLDEFKAGRVGFVAEVMGFSFVASKNDSDAAFKFRSDFEKTEFIRKQSTDRKTGVPSAVEKLVVADKKTKGVTYGAVLKRISTSFSKHLPDLTEIVNETSKDEFVSIPADPDSERPFEGIFLFLKDWKDPSIAEERFRMARSDWHGVKSRIDGLSKKVREFEELAHGNIPLTHSLEADSPIISSIERTLERYHSKLSPYTKFLLSSFIEKTVEVVEPKLGIIEKRFVELQDSLSDTIVNYKVAFENIKGFGKDTFIWINDSRAEIRKRFQQEFKEACQDFTKSGKIDLENIPDTDSFIENLEEIRKEIQTLVQINESINQCKAMAREVNEKLLKWG